MNAVPQFIENGMLTDSLAVMASGTPSMAKVDWCVK
jgi:hypothetical protein